MRFFIVALFAFTLAGCSGEEQAAEKEMVWIEATSQFFNKPRTIDELHNWLRARKVYYTFDASDVQNGTWKVGLEQVYVETLNCEAWTINLTIQVAQDGIVMKHAVSKTGRCLL